MVKQSFDLNVPKDSSNTNEAAQNGGTPMSVTFKNHHGGCFTPTHSRLNVLPKAVKIAIPLEIVFVFARLGSLGTTIFLRQRLGLDYGLHTLNVDAYVLEMKKYVKDNMIVLVYVEHESSNRASSVEGPIVVETVDDPFEDLDEILGEYANTRKKITMDEIIRKHMIVHVDYDPKHDQVFDDDYHIVKDVPVSMNNFSFTADPKHDLSIGVIEVQKHDIDVIDYDSFGSNLDDRIDSERRIQLRELRRICKQINKGPNNDIDMGKNVFSQTKGGPVTRENIISGKQNILGKDKTYQEKGKKVNKQKKEDKYSCPWTMLVAYTNEGRWEYSLLREYAQELINQNSGTTVRIDVQQQLNPESLTRIFRRVYVCLGALKQGFRACDREILGLDGCFMSESKASWCWFLNLLGEDLGIEANFNFTFIFDRQKPYLMLLKKATEYIVQWNGGHLYQVTRPYRDQRVVNMDIRVCSCRKWELTEIPCKHVMAAIYNMFENATGFDIPELWVHAAYILETLAHVYSFKINPSPNTTTGARNASSQAAGASQPSASPSKASQGPTQHSVGPRQAQMATKGNLGRLLPHARGLGFKPRRGGFPSGAKKEWGLSPKVKVQDLHTAQLDVTVSSNH
nr:transposase, mutator type [Tanacetum cinerariifolium]